MFDTDELIEKFKEQIKINPANVMAHYKLGETLHGAGRKDEAIAEYRKALKLDTNKKHSAIIHCNLGTLYHRDKKLEEAILEFEHTIKDLPKLEDDKSVRSDIAIRAYYSLGCALLDKIQLKEYYSNKKDDLKNAEKNFQLVLKFSPNFSGAKINLETIRRMIKYD